MSSADNLRAAIGDSLLGTWGARPGVQADRVMRVLADPAHRLAIFDAMGLDTKVWFEFGQTPVYVVRPRREETDA